MSSRPVDPANPALAAELDALLESHFDEFVAFRRRLHMHPEVSGREYATTESIVSRLQVSALQPLTLPGGTGLVCDVPGSMPGPMVALRADIDALAMDELLDAPYRSQVSGVAHCCGHDVHTTIVMASGLILSRLLHRFDAPPGSVRLIFEPNEESVPGGAVEIIDQGHLAGVDSIFALHCDPKADVGVIRVSEGAITSATDMVRIGLKGPGGHTARPDQTVDLVRIAGRIAVDAPDLLDRAAGRPGTMRLVFGSVQAGDAVNVLPTRASLGGTLRAQDPDDWEAAPDLLVKVIDQLVAGTGAEWSIEHDRGVPPVVNDPIATRLIADVARSLLGPHSVLPAGQSWGGDSFAWYLDHAPGSYVRLGVHDPRSNGPRGDLHAGNFTVDEDAIAVGIRLLVGTALRALAAAR